jgi:hypothetical protein
MSGLAVALRRLEARVAHMEVRRAPAPAVPPADELAGAAGLGVLDPWQRDVLAAEAPAVLLNCSRQAGKSAVSGLAIVRALWQGGLVVILTPSERQSKELYRTVLRFWRHLGRPVAHVRATMTSLELANGARLLALPASESTIRGISAVNLLVVDEASRVPDELYSTVSPMLAVSGGRLLAPSTPAGKRGWWYERWRDREDAGVQRFEVPATQVARIPRAWLAAERRRIGDYFFGQEYLCQFAERETAAFRDQDIQAMFQPDLAVASWLFRP